jgi:collagen type VI alpha
LTDVVLVIDASDSIRNDRFPLVIALLMSVVDQLDVGFNRTRVAAVKFANTASVQFHLNEYKTKQDVIAAIQRIAFVGGRTNISGALWIMKEQMLSAANGYRSDAHTVAILISDGAANIDRPLTIPYAVELRNLGVYIVTLAVGSLVDTVMMSAIASPPIEYSMLVADRAAVLPNYRDGLINSTCDDLNECLSNPCLNGAQCVNSMHRYYCQCLNGFTGEHCQRQCNRSMDLTVVLDLSGSDEDLFQVMSAFTQQLIFGLPVDTTAARVAIVTYSDTASISFQLNRYSSRQQMYNALSYTFSQLGGQTNTQAALLLTHSVVFNATQGDRPTVPNIAIIVTDGQSNVQADQTQIQAKIARDRGIELYAVAVGTNPGMVEINGIASQPTADHVFTLTSLMDAANVASTLIDHLCR